MQVTPADIVDRLTILDLKVSRLPYNADVALENRVYRTAFEEANIPRSFYDHLLSINAHIWDLEYAIRVGELSDPKTEADFAEIGRRAVRIRHFNGRRIAVKNEITAHYGGFVEVKGNHVSEALKA